MKNTANLKPDGTRSCSLAEFGRGTRAVRALLKAWGVDAVHWIDRIEVTRDTRRAAMCRFDDGLWRHCSFGGLDGTPMADASRDGFPGETGAIAHLRFRIHHARNMVGYRRSQLQASEKALADLEARLAQEAGAPAGFVANGREAEPPMGIIANGVGI